MSTVPITISLVALLLSITSVYFQFFHKRDVASCTLVGSNVEKSLITAQLVIGNAGTRPIMLRGARLWLRFKSGETGFIGHDNFSHHNIREPILIPKGELKSITLTLPIDDSLRSHIENWHNTGQVIDSDGSWPIRARLTFVTVSGKIIHSDESVITVEWKKDGHSYSTRDDAWQIGSWKFDQCLKRLTADFNS